jgi:hypothetical protein
VKLRAAESLLSRILGKPKETVQTQQVPEDLKAIREMSREERDDLYARLMADRGYRRGTGVTQHRKARVHAPLSTTLSCTSRGRGHQTGDGRPRLPRPAEPRVHSAGLHSDAGYPSSESRASESRPLT